MSESVREIERGIVTNAPDAARVERVLQLFPEILLRHDPRVQAVYQSWHERMIEDERRPASHTPSGVVDGLVVDLQAIVALINDLGLAQYKSWLAQGLLLSFL